MPSNAAPAALTGLVFFAALGACALGGCAGGGDSRVSAGGDSRSDLGPAPPSGASDAAAESQDAPSAGGGGALADAARVPGVDARALPGADAASPADLGPVGADARVEGDVAVAPSTDAALPPAVPLGIPAEQWSAVMIEGMTCADGTPTGIAVNPGPPGARRVFIYLIGGGACWDRDTCYDNPRAAAIEEPMLPQAFLGSDLARLWFFDRANPDNVFAADHLVFVPYCTGDIHAGDRIANYGGRETRHVGGANFARLAARLSAAFPETERVVLSGGSAGGYGAALNWQRALDAFPRARVDVVDDSGPIFAPPHLAPGLLATWAAAWGLAATVPADCPTCAVDLSAHIAHGLARARGGRFGLLSSVGDAVIASYLEVGAAEIERGLGGLQAGAPAGYGAFLVPGESHVLMAAPWVAGGLSIPAWIRAMLTDDPAWGSVGPEALPACNVLADCAGCAVCAAQGPCQRAYEACNAFAGCVDAVVCALGCAPADQQCIVACGAAHDALRQEALDLYDCARCDTCGAQCGACP